MYHIISDTELLYSKNAIANNKNDIEIVEKKFILILWLKSSITSLLNRTNLMAYINKNSTNSDMVKNKEPLKNIGDNKLSLANLPSTIVNPDKPIIIEKAVIGKYLHFLFIILNNYMQQSHLSNLSFLFP